MPSCIGVIVESMYPVYPAAVDVCSRYPGVASQTPPAGLFVHPVGIRPLSKFWNSTSVVPRLLYCMVYVMVSPKFAVDSEALLEIVRPGSPRATLTVDDEVTGSFDVPTAAFGMRVPVVPLFTCARNETDPFCGDVIYAGKLFHVMFCPIHVPPL
jgi:hypothetical protein